MPGFSRSATVASGIVFHSSSSLLICCAEICRVLSCSCSVGSFTSHGKNARSSMSGSHAERSQLLSFEAGADAHGCRHNRTTTVSLRAGMNPVQEISCSSTFCIAFMFFQTSLFRRSSSSSSSHSHSFFLPHDGPVSLFFFYPKETHFYIHNYNTLVLRLPMAIPCVVRLLYVLLVRDA